MKAIATKISTNVNSRGVIIIKSGRATVKTTKLPKSEQRKDREISKNQSLGEFQIMTRPLGKSFSDLTKLQSFNVDCIPTTLTLCKIEGQQSE